MLESSRGGLVDHLWRFVERRLPPKARDVSVEIQRLRGGLISEDVVHVAARFVHEDGERGITHFVSKRLDGMAVREAKVYERLLRPNLGGLAPELYGIHASDAGTTHLYLEAIAPLTVWPWKDLSFAEMVLERISALHGLPTNVAHHDFASWNYEADLAEAARSTVEAFEAACGAALAPDLRRGLPALRRLRHHLPAIREQLKRCALLPSSIIHGDLHPGNVVMRYRAGEVEPVLIDWARARFGSPLEDVASWLQWLGFWEPEARRKHDTLLGAYLRARGLPATALGAVRNNYWLAGASNCYAGVMTYHLSVASETEPDAPEHGRALAAVRDCLRVIRRADVYFRS